MSLLGAIVSSTNMNTEQSAPVPSDYDAVTGQSTTSATLEDITGLTFSLTTPSTGRIFAVMAVECTSSGAATAGGWAVSINAVDGTDYGRAISGATDIGSLTAICRSGSLAAGAYTVKGRHRRRSGATTVNTDTAELFAFFVAD